MTKFEIICTPQNSSKLLFNYRYISVNKTISDRIGIERLEHYLGKYRLCVSENVVEKFRKTGHYELLEELNSGEEVMEMMNPAHTYKLYMRCLLSVKTVNILKKLFVSTLVYNAEKMKCPLTESITIEFDVEKRTATISDLSLYMPRNDPFYRYARNAASILSTEAIGLDGYCSEKTHKIKNFYDSSKMTPWKAYEYLEREKNISDMPGIYMLYDSASNEVYIGKAKRLKERIEQHTKTPSDYMCNFTHYRYSAICDEYFEFLYLIENAAIHDAAQIVEMTNAKNYTSSLASLVKKTGNSLDECRLVNRVECQTKKQI